MLKGYCVLADYGKEAIKLFEENGVALEINEGKRPDESQLKSLVQEYDVLIIGVKEKMTKAVYENAKALKILGTVSNGTDHIDEVFLNSSAVRAFNCPLSNVISVAEHTFGLILSLQKRIAEGNDCVISGAGRNGLYSLGHDLYGKKIGIIGAGSIASEVINLARAFKMKICCYTFNPQRYAGAYGPDVEFADLDTVLAESDIVSVHLPLSELSKNLISSQKIELMKKNAIFINTSREGIADTRSLIRHADQNPEFRVGLDIDTDNLDGIFDKRRHNVIVTPHIAGVSPESRCRMDDELAENITDYLKNA